MQHSLHANVPQVDTLLVHVMAHGMRDSCCRQLNDIDVFVYNADLIVQKGMVETVALRKSSSKLSGEFLWQR